MYYFLYLGSGTAVTVKIFTDSKACTLFFAWTNPTGLTTPKHVQSADRDAAMGDNDIDILPTLYQYYTEGGIQGGLNDTQSDFLLNGKKIKIFSGALHYFRVHPEYWRDRLRKYRAAGLNCVETYVPWNVHEPEDGRFDFGGNVDENDFSLFLDLVRFVEMAQEEDLLVILRPGPYICAEWEFGGLPSWLLRQKDIKVRTSDPKYLSYVERYFKQLLPLVAPLQFSKGGSIIAVQIENEYGNVKEESKPIDTAYLEALKTILTDNGIVELLFTSDTPTAGFNGTLSGVLATANFQEDCSIELGLLKSHQPNKPLMVMEYWTGWFDHYTEKHHERASNKFEAVLEEILMWNSSFNLYMMHGGTNWGFLNGANIFGTKDDNSGFQPDTSSYDYDAPLSENGDYTDKYLALQRLTAEYNDIYVKQPSPPEPTFRIAYPDIEIIGELSLNSLIDQSLYSIKSETLVSMEQLDINNGNGQSYGYIVYRKENIDIKAGSVLKVEGHVCDTVLVLINGTLVSKVLETEEDLNGFGYWRKKDSSISLGTDDYSKATLDLVVENFGRVNYGKLYQFNQYKGLWQGNVSINNEIISNWKIVPLEFKKQWTKNLTDWNKPSFKNGPRLYKAVLNISSELKDTYIDFKGWSKGFIIVNGFVLTRFFKLGPQQSGYLPAPFLKRGENEILIFEHFVACKSIKFCTDPYFETVGDGKVLRKLLEQ
ncbi:beta-galactosidase-1-like protein 2 [Sitophilus oryzae]|uniref:Beta-galactosidase-1-like protein 2 n=1 Tax=Sitophilus oryzae TaxID=7048 RepID=A0A6J2YXL2_SITOR|nr:beta-galactosidase-1-like protein 2 [Sitophilus oryzae]